MMCYTHTHKLANTSNRMLILSGLQECVVEKMLLYFKICIILCVFIVFFSRRVHPPPAFITACIRVIVTIVYHNQCTLQQQQFTKMCHFEKLEIQWTQQRESVNSLVLSRSFYSLFRCNRSYICTHTHTATHQKYIQNRCV